MTARLAAHGLVVRYGPVTVVDGVDLAVDGGEVVALLGTNGAGKSTILRALCGLLAPAAGSVWLDGREVTGLPPDRRAERGLATVLGGGATFPSLTVEETLRLGFRGTRRAAERRVAETLARYPLLADRRRQQAGSLSAGEQQLLALARATADVPRVLLVDELSLGLSPVAADSVLASVTTLAAMGVAVLVVEQSPERAAAVAPRCLFIERGQVQFAGATAELLGRRDLLRPVLLARSGSFSTSPVVVENGEH